MFVRKVWLPILLLVICRGQENLLCENMQPVCTDAGANFFVFDSVFQAPTGYHIGDSDNGGNYYKCLYSWPDPTWFYFQISDSSPANGELYLDLFASRDIDFIIYGPFSDVAAAKSNCGRLGVGSTTNQVKDCSYSGTASETPAISNVQPGEVYIMLVTNYAQTHQGVSLTVSPASTGTSTAFTDCRIVPPCGATGAGLIGITEAGVNFAHACQCKNDCDPSSSGAFCVNVNLVATRLTQTIDEAQCEGTQKCCCSCPNCLDFIAA